jgi:hypothetical protein
MLHTVATIGTYGEIAGKLNDRYSDRVDRIEFSTPVATEADAAALKEILSQIR